MSVSRILDHASLSAKSPVIKLGPRKSIQQPQVWMAAEGSQPRWVLKFAAPGQLGAASRLECEIRFLRAVADLSETDPIRERVPALRAEGLVSGYRYVVLPYYDLPGSDPHVTGRGSSSVLPWLSEKLDWLRALQTHQRLRTILAIPPSEVPVHGDYSHYNFLEARGRLVVLDWEDWSHRPQRYLDAVHCAVMPTLLGTTPEQRADSFARYWLHDSAYRRGVWRLLASFAPECDLEAMLDGYLRFQLELLADGPTEIRRGFELCLARKRGVHAV